FGDLAERLAVVVVHRIDAQVAGGGSRHRVRQMPYAVGDARLVVLGLAHHATQCVGEHAAVPRGHRNDRAGEDERPPVVGGRGVRDDRGDEHTAGGGDTGGD